MKIIISGHSGTGKTTLARAISQQHDIPFITTSSKVIWDRLGITCQKDIITKTNNDPEWGLQFQLDLLHYRASELSKYDNYVTDRGTLDNLVYLIVNCSHLLKKEVVDLYINKCIELTPKEDDVINIHLASSLEMLTKHLEDDDKRISNPYFQSMVNQTFEMVLANNIIPTQNLLYFKTWDFNHKLMQIHSLINSKLKVNKLDNKQFYKKKK